MAQADTLQYEYRGLAEEHADAESIYSRETLFGVMSPSRIPNPEDDQFCEYGVSEMKELWNSASY